VVNHGDGSHGVSFHELGVFRLSNATFSIERVNQSDRDGGYDLYRDLYGRFGLRGDRGDAVNGQGNGRES
jgi:hypothetical protein